MKIKIIIFVLLNCLLLMAMCSCVKDNSVVNIKDNGISDTDDTTDTATSFLEVDHLEVDWDKAGFTVNTEEFEITIDNTSLNSFDDAVLIGEDIADQWRNGSNSIEYELRSIVHATEDGIWRLDYTKKQYRKGTDELIDMHGCHVAIDDDCNVIRMWVQEW